MMENMLYGLEEALLVEVQEEEVVLVQVNLNHVLQETHQV